MQPEWLPPVFRQMSQRPNNAAAPVDRLPDITRAALMLDLDGTLIDIAPTPEQVVVTSDLPATLQRLRTVFDDALAIVTGRPIEQVDALLGDLPYAVAGEHGAAIRHAPGAAIERAPLPEPPLSWLTRAEQLAALHPGVRLERKERGFVLHYRAVPEAGPALQAALEPIVAEQAAFVLVPARMAWEVRPRGADKGSAVEALMRLPPFAGRLPVFIGDDVTDEDGMRVARTLGGAGLRVPDVFNDARGVRAWLVELAATAKEGRWAAW
jgi:trehalose 6-phosphate phosphatase